MQETLLQEKPTRKAQGHIDWTRVVLAVANAVNGWQSTWRSVYDWFSGELLDKTYIFQIFSSQNFSANCVNTAASFELRHVASP